MPDEPGASTPVVDAGTPPAGAPPSTPPSTTTATDPPAPPAGDVDWQKEAQKNAKESAAYRERLRTAEEALKKIEDANLTEAQRTAKERDEAVARASALEEKVKEQALKTAVFSEAAKIGVVDPDAAYLLLDKSSVKVDGDKVTGVDKALADLVKAKPYLVNALNGGAPTNANRSSNTQTTAQRDAELRAKMYGRAPVQLSPEEVFARGGGVRGS